MDDLDLFLEWLVVQISRLIEWMFGPYELWFVE